MPASHARASRKAAHAAGAVVLALAAAAAAASATYTVKLESEFHGLDIKVETVENPGALILKLTNASDRKVRCKLRYDAAPQPLARRTVYIEPGKTEDNVFAAKRKWFNVDVAVDCKPADE
jgi:hypothetical protein